MHDKPKPPTPPHLQRSLLVLIIVLMGVSVARLLVSMHQQQERIEILEAQVSQLMSDTSRLSLSAAPIRHSYPERSDYRHSNNSYRHARYTPSQARHTAATTAPRDTSLQAAPSAPVAQVSHKFTEAHLFDLNTIDSLTLIRIPGIAAATASTILKHRQRYGGFYDPQQLREFLTWDAAQVYLDEWCTQWFTADSARLLRLRVNTATLTELQRHPYITHQQAVEILLYRQRHQHIGAATELRQLTTFTSQQLQQVLPYLSFD